MLASAWLTSTQDLEPFCHSANVGTQAWTQRQSYPAIITRGSHGEGPHFRDVGMRETRRAGNTAKGGHAGNGKDRDKLRRETMGAAERARVDTRQGWLGTVHSSEVERA